MHTLKTCPAVVTPNPAAGGSAGALRSDPRRVLDVPGLYTLWQAPFVRQKLRPFLRHNGPPRSLGRVLELGCGPGTNAGLFDRGGYVGLDLNPAYVSAAADRHGGDFRTADAAAFDPAEVAGGGAFDAVFVNSLLHHLDDDAVAATLGRAAAALRPGGTLHLTDLVLPAEFSVARSLALLDRGHHARPAADWVRLVERAFAVDLVEPFPIGLPGLPCWRMLYLRGVRRAG